MVQTARAIFLLTMYFRLKTSPSGQVLQLLESYRNSEGLPLKLWNDGYPELLGEDNIWSMILDAIGRSGEKSLPKTTSLF
ncbi:MAG: hypothetical protein V1899_11750 [Planctomycetota bacterium]